MQRQKRVLSVIRQLKKLSEDKPNGNSYAVAALALEWVLDKEKDIQDIFPEISLYEKPKDKKLFDYNERQRFVWFSPALSRWVWEYKVPKHTPQRWWTEVVEDELIGLEAVSAASLEKGYLNHLPSLEESIEKLGEVFMLHWSQIDTFYDVYRDIFRNRNEVVKFLSNDFEIDYSTMVELRPADRHKINEEKNVNFNKIKSYLQEEEGLIFIYNYKNKGEDVWVFHNTKEDLNEENYYGFR